MIHKDYLIWTFGWWDIHKKNHVNLIFWSGNLRRNFTLPIIECLKFEKEFTSFEMLLPSSCLRLCICQNRQVHRIRLRHFYEWDKTFPWLNWVHQDRKAYNCVNGLFRSRFFRECSIFQDDSNNKAFDARYLLRLSLVGLNCTMYLCLLLFSTKIIQVLRDILFKGFHSI